MKGKVIIITGASSGIGEACSILFARKGASVVMAARNHVKLEKTVASINENGGNAIAVETDVTSEKDCENLIQTTVKKYGKIDIMVNNAGISMRAKFIGLDTAVLKKLMDVNFWGTVYCTKYALPFLLESKGSLIGISSIAGFKGLPGRTGYSASKFAIHGFLETIRIEHLKNGLHVMVVAPGFTTSNIRKTALNGKGEMQQESPRDERKMMSPYSVAKAISWGIRTKRRNMILSWKGKLLVLFQRVLPKTIDRLAYMEMKAEKDSPL
jgi:short-subunit dehydrogenase